MAGLAAAAQTHDEWQAQVVELAALNGWEHLHVRKSVGRGKKWTTTTNRKGWPDLFFWHERDQRQLAVEIKVGRDKPTSEQLETLRSLAAAGIETAVWYPAQFDEAVQVLARRRARH